ncbi:MAG: glycosyltransferase family 39 protein, partial [Bacteroidales bacterium]
MNIKISSNHLVLIFILLAGTLLRIWHLVEIPLTHDEFSVVLRTGYDSFAELIKQGVRIDVHPAGVQVFMNYWVALFGESAVAVKIPFILFGIFSILMVYKIGEEWFNPTVGLITAVFVACLEYTVMYSQIARPYMSGVFFSLLMVYGWQRYLFRPGKSPIAWLILYVLASAVSAYNHYFSLMFAAVVGVSGLCFVTRRRLITYSLAGIAIFGLYIPHLPIFFHQFSEKGVEGWLGKPGNDFIIDYIGYIFHFSPLVYAMVAIIIVAGIRLQRGTGMLKSKFFIISLAWFILPILIGFFYSRYVNAVLQYSGLIFTFPFFLFILFGNLPDIKKPVKYLAVPLISLALILTLIYGRQYYSLFYQSRFKHLILDTEQT